MTEDIMQFVMNKDACPRDDMVLTSEQCRNCEHYHRVVPNQYGACVECSYYTQFHQYTESK